MPRPAIDEQVRQAVRDYLAVAVNKRPDEAPLNVLAVAKCTRFDRKTLKKYGLDAEIAAAAKQQSRGGKLSAINRSSGDPIPTRCINEIKKLPCCAKGARGLLRRSAWRKAMPSDLASTRPSFGNRFRHPIGQCREPAGGRHTGCDGGPPMIKLPPEWLH